MLLALIHKCLHLLAGILVLIAACACALAQPATIRQIEFQRFSVDNGLSQNFVTCIVQDYQGFVWIGTRDGLNRFDGYHFKTYSFDAQDTTSISANAIYSIFEDRNKALWIRTGFGGLCKYDRANDSFVRYRYEQHKPSLLPLDVSFPVLDDDTGMLWLGTSEGLKRLDPKTGKFRTYMYLPDDPESDAYNHVYALLGAKDGNLWLGTLYPYSGLMYFDRSTHQFWHFKFSPDDFPHRWPLSVRTILRDTGGDLWIGDGAGVFRVSEQGLLDRIHGSSADEHRDVKRGLIKVANSLTEIVWTLQQDEDGNLWTGSPHGLYVFDVHRPHQEEPTLENRGITQLLSNRGVTCIFRDRSGLMWLGTNGHGVYKVRSERKRFDRLTIQPAVDDPGRTSVRAIYEDGTGRIWIGGYNGLQSLDRTTGRVTSWNSQSTTFGGETVWVIYEDPVSSGRILWIGTESGGLYRFDRSRGTFKQYRSMPGDPRSLNDNFVLSVYRDSAGTMWVGTNAGLHRFDDRTETFTQYNSSTGTPRSLQGTFLLSILESRYGGQRGLWLTTQNGLHFFNPATEGFTRFGNEPGNPKSLSQNDVLSILQDRRGRIWVGTGGGLNQLLESPPAQGENAPRVTFVHYTEKDGLPNNTINGILEDDEGQLWISTNKGLSRFNPETGSFRNYDVSDGLQSNEFNRGAYYRSDRGEMFFGGINGVNTFFPRALKDNPHLPPVVITAFKLFNEPLVPARDDAALHLHQAILLADEIHLSHDENVFSFEFSALEYTAVEKNQYAYMMVGFDRDWRMAGTNREAVYTNLDPGEYTFRVKASNNDGVWNEKGASVKVTIAPPLWRTWWAYTAYVLLLALAFYGVRRYELNRARLKTQVRLQDLEAKKLKELDAMRSHFFSNISHEFRTPLTLILGPVETLLARNTGGDAQHHLKLIRKSAAQLLRLVNQVLNLARLESGKMGMELSRGDIIHCFRSSAAAFESLAQSRSQTLLVQTAVESLETWFNREHMETVFSNVLSNALKFTPDRGEIRVKCSLAGIETAADGGNLSPWLLFTVQDSGIGIPADKLKHVFERFYRSDNANVIADANRRTEGTGIGLALVKELVELYKGTVTIRSEEGRGTEVTVRLPVYENPPEGARVMDAVPQRLPARDDHMPLEESIGTHRPIGGPHHASGEENIILIVEDNPDMQDYLRSCLEPEYRVIMAKDGEAGLSLARERIPDLVISDVMIPAMDGLELCAALKTDEKTSHLPVVLLTAKAGEEDRLEGLETGADAYLTKPFIPKELSVQVTNLVRTRRKLRQKFSTESFLQSGRLSGGGLDEAFLQRATGVVEKYINDENFSVEVLAKELRLSRTQLHRKLTALTNQPAARFIRSVRMHHAKKLLRQNGSLINEVAFLVGFNSHAYFSKCFHEEFGCSPSEFVKANR